VIVDADARELARLAEALGRMGIELAGRAESAAAGIRAVDEVVPDIALVSMDLEDSSGLDVVRAATHDPSVILLAATDVWAVTAFEEGAVDYLVRPFGTDRLTRALGRAVERAVGRAAARAAARAAHAGQAGQPGQPGQVGQDAGGRPAEGRGEEEAAAARQPVHPRGRLERLFLREREGIVPVPVTGITRFAADGDYVVVHRGQRRHLVRLRLQDLASGLGRGFLRIHRSHVVNLDHVRIFEQGEDGRLVAVMDDGARITASRSGSRALRRLAR
jgi:two-component system LytT family response regulator